MRCMWNLEKSAITAKYIQHVLQNSFVRMHIKQVQFQGLNTSRLFFSLLSFHIKKYEAAFIALIKLLDGYSYCSQYSRSKGK